MDMLTRKKFLLKNYNNLAFTTEEIDFFKKTNATEIISLLKQNPSLRESLQFYQHISIREIEKIIANIFQPEDYVKQSQILNIMVNILRKSSTILQVCFSNKDFNYMSIFGFLEEDHVDYSLLILLEDLLLPYIRKNPFQIMNIIVNDDFVQKILLKRAYERPVFKIMYTVIFCLSKRHSESYNQSVRKIIHELVNTPFTYLFHKQKKTQEKANLIKIQQGKKKNPKSISKNFIEDSPVHKKKVRQKKTTSKGNSSPSKTYSDVYKNGAQLQYPYKLQFTQEYIQTQQSQEEWFKTSNKSQCQLNEIKPLWRITSYRFHSSASVQQNKEIVLNEDLDFGDLTENVRDLLSDLTINIKFVHLKNVVILFQDFNESYIDSLISHCRKFILNEEYDTYCQGAISILLQFTELYKAIYKQSLNVPNNLGSVQNQNRIPVPTQYENELTQLMNRISKEIKTIASKLPLLCSFILQNNQTSTLYSSGQRIKKVGLLKYRILQVIHSLLSFNDKSNTQCYLNLSNQIDFKKIDLFQILQKYLTTVKWNNILHSLLIKITQLAVKQDYQNFKQRCIVRILPKDKIIGTLIQLFRNKKFVYLANLKFTNFGNIHTVYSVSKIIVKQVINHGDYDFLVEKFHVFDQFLKRDIAQYEKTLGQSRFFDEKTAQTERIQTNQCILGQEINEKMIPINEVSLQNGEELIQNLQNSKRWIVSAINMINQETE